MATTVCPNVPFALHEIYHSAPLAFLFPHDPTHLLIYASQRDILTPHLSFSPTVLAALAFDEA